MARHALFAFAALLLVASASASFPRPLLASESETRIDGEYIVVFASNVTVDQRDSHVARLAGSMNSEEAMLKTFTINDFKAYHARLSQKTLEGELNNPMVDYIEFNQVVKTTATVTQTNAPWGLSRINTQSTINLNGQYTYDSTAGEGVDAYIIDTGIYAAHTDFGGRATTAWSFDGNLNDCNGHGTHVAGTVGGTRFGVAKRVNLIGVKVLNCEGSGTNAGVIAGIEYAANQVKATRRKSVGNMSLGGGASSAVDNAVTTAIGVGLNLAVAAGNDNANACNGSPARVGIAVTVGASDVAGTTGGEKDIRSSFSSFGSCVDIFAPGSLILSAWIGSTTATNTISGTSMATPHVCGVMALYLGANGETTPANLKSLIVAGSTKNVLDLKCTTTVCSASPNALLYAHI